MGKQLLDAFVKKIGRNDECLADACKVAGTRLRAINTKAGQKGQSPEAVRELTALLYEAGGRRYDVFGELGERVPDARGELGRTLVAVREAGAALRDDVSD